MFTRKRIPSFQPSGDWAKDGPQLVKWITDFFGSLEQKNALTIAQNQIYVDQGLQFPATQVSSSDVNNLDDYEEGTWTPADASGASLTLTASGTYTKCGRFVFARFAVTYPTTADTSATSISGLPFSVVGASVGAVFSQDTVGAQCCKALSGTTTISLFAAKGVAITNANMSAKIAQGNLIYEAST